MATATMIAVQILVLLIFIGATMAYGIGRQTPPAQMIERLSNDPLTLCVALLTSAIVALAIVWLAVKRRGGWRFREYLALRGFAPRQFIVWFLVLAVLLLTGDQVLQWVGDDSGEAFIRSMLISGRSVAPLMLAVALAAPVIEELLFRGFMFRGLAASRAGLTGAIMLPNILWTILHFQYARPTLVLLFGMGLVLGMARHFSGSVILPLVLHAMSNAASAITVLRSMTP
jgi:membrane protease YdiL (CAAX protease family)